jgi:glutathione S-transferase
MTTLRRDLAIAQHQRRRTGDMVRILYSGTKNASSWAFRAWLALREAGIDFEEEVVDIRRPQRYANLNRIAGFSPAGSVPVLVDGDTVVFDSLAIMEYANDLAGGRLMPVDPLERARARSFVAWQHAGLGNCCPLLSFESCFYPDRREMTLGERDQAARVYAAWEDQLAAHGGAYLFGGLSLADLALLPGVMRLSFHDRDLSGWPRVAAWTQSLLSRPAVREWLDEAALLPPVRNPGYWP